MSAAKKGEISVIIPAYNAQNAIERTLESVYAQTRVPHEVIVIDDGSNDATASIVKKFARGHKNLVLLRQENSGPAAARNAGMRAARGDYIAFCDADDEWLPEKLALQCAWLDENSSAGMIGARVSEPAKEGAVSQVSFIRLLFKNEFVTSTVVMRREAAIATGFSPTQRYSEDYRLWLQVVHERGGAVMERRLAVYGGGKPGFGHSGLSSRLWKMEKGELSNYWFLLRRGYFPAGIFLFVPACGWSLAKFLRRILLSSFRRFNER